jgi:NAD(P)-dependent dehydrogenase (short-subunit alcohol dehydrogenase family)
MTNYANFSLSNRTVLITGAASGIGQAIAVGCGEHGAKLALLDRPGASLEATVDLVAPTGAQTVCIGVDVTDGPGLTAAVTQLEEVLGPLWGAVNCAGIANACPAEEMPLDQWQHLYDVDVTGVFLACQAEGRAMIAHGGGSIINIASMSGSIVNRGLLQAHYNSAKAAVIHLSKSLAMEWAPRTVRVNSISPGYTATPMNTRPEVADQAVQFAKDTPVGRMAEPSEMSGPAVFLLSDAASFVTGHDLIVDGGFTAW